MKITKIDTRDLLLNHFPTIETLLTMLDMTNLNDNQKIMLLQLASAVLATSIEITPESFTDSAEISINLIRKTREESLKMLENKTICDFCPLKDTCNDKEKLLKGNTCEPN